MNKYAIFLGLIMTIISSLSAGASDDPLTQEQVDALSKLNTICPDYFDIKVNDKSHDYFISVQETFTIFHNDDYVKIILTDNFKKVVELAPKEYPQFITSFASSKRFIEYLLSNPSSIKSLLEGNTNV